MISEVLPSLSAASTPVRHIPANAKGRDFVAGDLHGERLLLKKFMDQVHFDPAADRVISVGDLVDRGPDSPGTLALLAEPWFFAVKGNHECMLLDCLREYAHSGRPGLACAHYFFNGGDWLSGHLESGAGLRAGSPLQDLVGVLANLPLLLVVGKGKAGRYNVVHAELPAGMQDADVDALVSETTGALQDILIWSRRIMGKEPWDGLPSRNGLSPTYCGHTVSATVRMRDGHICLDTGACLPHFNALRRGEGFGLSIANPASGEIWRVDAESLYVSHTWHKSA